MKILALEFSSPQRSAAVVQASGSAQTAPTSSREVVDTAPRSAKALGLVEEALRAAQVDRAQIDCLAIGVGPGSYSGIRSAIALAQGWQLAGGVDLLGVSSAECVAAQAQSEGVLGRVHVVIDAQRNEFYLATYELDAAAWRETEPLQLATLAEVRARAQTGGTLLGPEVVKWFSDGRVVFPRAATLARLALRRTDFAPGEKIEPIYLRATQFVKAPPPRIIPS
jgi:tRNA threonylcarbamoyl adenosine modification protein YeaZ